MRRYSENKDPGIDWITATITVLLMFALFYATVYGIEKDSVFTDSLLERHLSQSQRADIMGGGK